MCMPNDLPDREKCVQRDTRRLDILPRYHRNPFCSRNRPGHPNDKCADPNPKRLDGNSRRVPQHCKIFGVRNCGAYLD